MSCWNVLIVSRDSTRKFRDFYWLFVTLSDQWEPWNYFNNANTCTRRVGAAVYVWRYRLLKFLTESSRIVPLQLAFPESTLPSHAFSQMIWYRAGHRFLPVACARHRNADLITVARTAWCVTTWVVRNTARTTEQVHLVSKNCATVIFE